jgi:NAD(P)-dependent dehydrogenase (short-subunit alcohol dehydrogenase family)
MSAPQPMTQEQISKLYDLTGKVAIITGGAGFLGHASARGLAAFGADIVVTSRSIGSLEAVATEIKGLGRKALPIACDVTDEASVDAMVAKVMEEFGHIDILVTAAGIANRFPAEEFPVAEFNKIMTANVTGTFLSAQKVGQQMIKQGHGKIITIGSVRGFLGHPGGYAAYGTTKGAVHLMTQQLATEWAKYQINVNCIAPCIFWTPLTQQVLEDEKLKQIFMSRIPWGRAAVPDDMIGPIVFYSSAASDFITGTILPVDGGSVAG